MKFATTILLLLTLLFVFNCSPERKEFLQLNGEVVGTDTESIVLIKPNQDVRFDSLIEIPVINGKFHYQAELQNPEAVNLALAESVRSGAFKPMPLFLENEQIDLIIYPEKDFNKNVVKGGGLNADYKKFRQNFEAKFLDRITPLKDSMSLLFNSDGYNSDKAKTLHAELRKAKNKDEKFIIYKKLNELREANQYLSPEAKMLENKIKPINEEQKRFQEDYVVENPSIVSYSFLMDNLIFNKETIDIDFAKNAFEKLSRANPDHPYNKLASNLINALENVRVGNVYPDFSAPQLNGEKITLSDKINGEVALLDLWATWCGPCIAKSRTMVPLYNEYKNRGFTIVGVAGEFKNTDRLLKFLKKEKWEWLNLVELDRQNNIWQKYSIDNAGGGMFLIDEEGIILAKDPSVEEVRKVLESRPN